MAEPILDRNAKLATLKRLAAEHGLPLAAALAVGDGANDLAMIAGGRAWRRLPRQAGGGRGGTGRVDHADLRALLFAQGYRAAEILAA